MSSRRSALMALTLPLLAGERRPLLVILIGPPGSGKGTQAEKLSAEFKIPAISTGDLLRAEAASGSDRGRQISAVMESGGLVDDTVINALVAQRLERDDAARGAILDGYPRTVAQARALKRLLAGRKIPDPVVINLKVPEAEIMKRLAVRGRTDDEPATVSKRLRVYHRETRPLLNFYSAREVDGTGTPEQVYQRVRSAILGSTATPAANPKY